MAQYKPQIIQILKGGSSDGPAQPQGRSGGAGSGYTAPFVDLAAEAVLDPAIRPLEAAAAVDFTSAKEVLLAGASGFLGAYLLHTLMTDTPARVHCLIRCRSQDDGRKRIEENLSKYGLWSGDSADRIIAVPGDFTQGRLGMDAHAYDDLTNIVTSLGYRIEIVPYEQWRSALLEDVKTSTDNALPLFTDEPPFQRVPFFDCRQTVAGLHGSGIACPDMDANLIGRYLDYLRRSGFLSS